MGKLAVRPSVLGHSMTPKIKLPTPAFKVEMVVSFSGDTLESEPGILVKILPWNKTVRNGQNKPNCIGRSNIPLARTRRRVLKPWQKVDPHQVTAMQDWQFTKLKETLKKGKANTSTQRMVDIAQGKRTSDILLVVKFTLDRR